MVRGSEKDRPPPKVAGDGLLRGRHCAAGDAARVILRRAFAASWRRVRLRAEHAFPLSALTLSRQTLSQQTLSQQTLSRRVLSQQALSQQALLQQA
ncbi:MAG: hypothetical protein RSC00_04800, partial [Ruthenibacterium sp.]